MGRREERLVAQLISGLVKILFAEIVIPLIKILFKKIGNILAGFWSLTPQGKAKQLQIENLSKQWVNQTNPTVHLDGKIKYIYVYTTDSERLLNRYKVGETIRHPTQRIQEQDSTSNSSDLILIAYWHAGKTSDKKLHKLLEDHGYPRIRKNREWFEIVDPKATIPKMLAIANS